MIYSAKEIVTLDPARPSVAAVAVAGDRILATGSLDQVRTALGPRPYRLDTSFADQVIVPGLIAQHD
ncbi:MAG: amidohydrolase, partial [Cyanobacteriota bacterium]